MNGELENPDSIRFADSLKYKTPKGKIVYGGGGIMPDIYIPIEKDSTLIFYNQVVNKGLIYQFAFEYTDKNRRILEKYKTFREFDKNVRIDEGLYNEFLVYAANKSVKHEGGDLREADRRVKVLLKAYIGRNILDNAGFYPLLNTIDPVFNKTISILEKQ
jgi:carboxyl-terminal processing protease